MRVIKSIRLKGKNYDGWNNLYFQIGSFLLSCIKLTQFYDLIYIYTDDEGKKFIETKMEFLETKVYLLPDEVSLIPNGDKLYCCSIQSEPFIFFDNDVFTNKKIPFDSNFDGITVLCIGDNQGQSYRHSVDLGILTSNPHTVYDYNCGVLGGCNSIPFSLLLNSAFSFYKEISFSELSFEDYNYINYSYFLGQSQNQGMINIKSCFSKPVLIKYPFLLESIYAANDYIQLSNSLKRLKETEHFIIRSLKKIKPDSLQRIDSYQIVEQAFETEPFLITKQALKIFYSLEIDVCDPVLISQIIREHCDVLWQSVMKDVFEYERSYFLFKEKMIRHFIDKKSNNIYEGRFGGADLMTSKVKLSQHALIVESNWDWKLYHSFADFALLKIMYNLRRDPDTIYTLFIYNDLTGKLSEFVLDLMDTILFEVLETSNSVEILLTVCLSYFEAQIQNNEKRVLVTEKLIERILFWLNLDVVIII